MIPDQSDLFMDTYSPKVQNIEYTYTEALYMLLYIDLLVSVCLLTRHVSLFSLPSHKTAWP